MPSVTRFDGRRRRPVWKKINPVWWFMNDSQQTVDEAPWYHGDDATVAGWMAPRWPYWRRWLVWNTVRNPAQNLRAFCGPVAVIEVAGIAAALHFAAGTSWWWAALAVLAIGGVSDRNYDCVHRDPLCIQRDDLVPPQLGLQWNVLRLAVPLPFVSYCGRRFVVYFGWQPSGFFGAKANVRKEAFDA